MTETVSRGSEPAEGEREATDYLGTVVRYQGKRWQIVAVEDPPADPLIGGEATLVGETPAGGTYRWGLEIVADLSIVRDDLNVPERPDPVVAMDLQEGVFREKTYYQDNAVVRCADCAALVRESDAVAYAGDPADAHDYDRWVCDSCSTLIDGEAEALDVSEADLEDCPFVRWSDRLAAWTVGADYRVDDGSWRPDCIEPVTVDDTLPSKGGDA